MTKKARPFFIEPEGARRIAAVEAETQLAANSGNRSVNVAPWPGVLLQLTPAAVPRGGGLDEGQAQARALRGVLRPADPKRWNGRKANTGFLGGQAGSLVGFTASST